MLLSPLHPGDWDHHDDNDDDDDDDFNDHFLDLDFDDDGNDFYEDDGNGSYPIYNHQIRPAGGDGDALKDS